MTGYTEHRGYPYPSSERETGNGGLHSEQLARKVAGDLDVIDAGWAAELQRSSIILSLASDVSPLIANALHTVALTTVVKQTTGLGLAVDNIGLTVAKGGAGWYHFTAQTQSKANGAITANAQHRIQLDHIHQAYGGLVTSQTYCTESFQAGSGDMFLMVDAVVHLSYGDKMWLRFLHGNTGSDGRVVAAATHLTGSLIVKDS